MLSCSPSFDPSLVTVVSPPLSLSTDVNPEEAQVPYDGLGYLYSVCRVNDMGGSNLSITVEPQIHRHCASPQDQFGTLMATAGPFPMLS